MIKLINNLRIGTKLTGGFAIVILLLIVAIGFGYIGMKWLSESMSTLYFDQTVQIKNLSDVEIRLGRIKSNLLIYVEIPDNVQLQSTPTPDPVSGANTQQDSVPMALGQLDCSKCHAANVNGDHNLLADQKKGDITRCLTCHTDKANDAAHTTAKNTTAAAPTPVAASLPNCTKCHAEIVNGTHKLSANDKPGDANRCLICHRPIAESPMHGTGVMTEAECATCHPSAVAKTQRAALAKAFQEDITQINQVMQDYNKLDHTADEKTMLKSFDTSWNDYLNEAKTAITNVDNGKKMAAVRSLTDGTAQKKRIIVEQTLEQLIAVLHKEADLAQKGGTDTFQRSAYILFGAGLSGVVIALVLGFLITASIKKPLLSISNGLKNFQQGDLNRNRPAEEQANMTNRTDEIGIAGQGLVSAEGYLQEMANVAQKIADGDLTVSVTPRSPTDEFGTAFKSMIESLRALIGGVAESANNLEMASSEMSDAAIRAMQSTQNIVQSIDQVSIGIEQQTRSVKSTLETVSQMERAIEGVAGGAQDQSQSITAVSQITARINSATQQAAGNAAAVTERSIEAANAARSGSKTVEETLEGMHSIKERVGVSAAKVEEMGKRSAQISTIVETIDEIASQTNLLALNAAIEAARAGQQGKGFAVVADEVRKLAERSSLATREIGALVRTIQSTVTEAVSAMAMGTREVNTGVERANDAGRALSNILKAAEVVNIQADEARRMTGQVSLASDELIGAIERVSAVIEENTASAEEMAASSSEVTRAMEKIAGVSDNNDAAVKKVSNGAADIQSQMEQVQASAMSLAEMARDLQVAMEKFKLNE